MIELLTQGFDAGVFQKFLRSKFGSFSATGGDIAVDEDSGWTEAGRIGVVKTLPGPNGLNMPLVVVAAKLDDGEVLKERSSRIRQFNFARKVLDEAMGKPAPGVEGVLSQGLFVFYDDAGNFRLSLVYGRAEGTKLVWSAVRRQSFHVQAGDGNKTFRDRMALDWSTFDKLKDAFSVEKLTKEFYNRLFAWYQLALADDAVALPNDVVKDKEPGEVKSEQLIRLITRLMFVWFLKQKRLVPDELFDPEKLKGILKHFSTASGDTYYRGILQNLFFATLNSEVDERDCALNEGYPRNSKTHNVGNLYRYENEFAFEGGTKDEIRRHVVGIFKAIPFLNGGLFECLDKRVDDPKEETLYYDGFSRNPARQAHVPNRLFFNETTGLLPLLKQYHFTVEENSPGDEEVALDPELLGKVFENLLGAYNPETQVAARNATGSFYTPREIVNYMVDESLKAHVKTKVAQTFLSVKKPQAEMPVSPSPDTQTGMSVPPSWEDAVNALFTEGVRPADEALCKMMDQALVTAKILDPACGSGAFPMGILLRMVELLRILRGIPEDESVYDLKLELIENCIYGGDIQCIAVQISKLRFFISLVCEEGGADIPVCASPQTGMSVPPCAENNYGIHTLPNLETKFVAADSLIGLPKKSDALPMQNVEQMKKDLWELRHRHFLARSFKEKKALRKQDKALREKLARALEDGGGFDTASAKLMAEWDPYDQNASATFSDPEWMFNVKDGFDIVIGNPPYIKEYTNKAAFERIKGREYYMGKMDIWYYFACIGIDNLRRGGVLCFIATNNWVTNTGAAILRNKVVLDTKIMMMADFKSFMIFQNADIQTMIMLFKKSSGEREYDFDYRVLTKTNATLDDAVLLLQKDHEVDASYLCPQINRDRLVDKPLLFSANKYNDVLLKLESCKNCHYLTSNEVANGIHPHFDFITKKHSVASGGQFRVGQGVFGLSHQEKNILNLTEQEQKIVKPYFTTARVNRYFTNPNNDFWIIYTDSRFKDPKVMHSYPNLKKHLDKFCSVITSDNKPYGLHRSRDERFFKGEKIVALRKCVGRPSFSYSDFDCYVSATFYVIKPRQIEPKFLVGLLNSRLVEFWLRYRGKMQGDNFQIDKAPLLSIPICMNRNQDAVRKSVSANIDRILAAKRADPPADTSTLEAEIDRLVYELYGLTEEEIAIVDPASREATQGKGGAGGRSEVRSPKSEVGGPTSGGGRKKKSELPPSLPGWD